MKQKNEFSHQLSLKGATQKINLHLPESLKTESKSRFHLRGTDLLAPKERSGEVQLLTSEVRMKTEE